MSEGYNPEPNRSFEPLGDGRNFKPYSKPCIASGDIREAHDFATSF